DFGAIAHESTAPYAVLAVQLRHTLLLTVVAAIFVITMRQRNGSRTDELWVQAKLRARGVAQTTVDATGELVILCHLRRCLDVRILIRGAGVDDDVRYVRVKTVDEVGHIDNQIAFNPEVS